MNEELLRLNSVSIDYKVRDGYLSAVNNVSLTMNKSEIFAIVGESGCGKSTIAHSIMRLLGSNAKVTGNILFNGVNLIELSDNEITKVRGREIGMIFQNPLDSLNPVYTTGRQVNEAIMLDGIDRLTGWQRVLELYRDVKMPDAEKRAEAFPHEMSGGMRQRVMIAMMISRKPQLLIADEPTTALDVTIEAQILDIISELKREFNTAIMLITHNFGLVAEVADKVAIMYAGEIVEHFTVPPAIWKVPPDTEKRLPAKPAARLILISSAVATSIIFLLAGTSIVSPSSISLLILMYVGSLASAVLSGTAANASFRVA